MFSVKILFGVINTQPNPFIIFRYIFRNMLSMIILCAPDMALLKSKKNVTHSKLHLTFFTRIYIYI